jgi:DNA sulfur modification protein DndD
MIIKSISISNFMCYYGDNNVLEFTKGLNIVLGANGYGKSKLYDAFQWVFNDQVTNSDPNNKAGYKRTSSLKRELISEKALAEAHVGDAVECKVVIEILRSADANSESYRIARAYTCKKTAKDIWAEPNESKLSIYRKDILHYTPISEHENGGILERLLPTEVRPYVWFQGERGINALIDTSSEESLKNVIKRLSDITQWNDYIVVAQKAFETAKNAFDLQMRTAKRHGERIAKLQTEEADLEREIAKYDRLIEEYKRNLKAAQDKSEQFDVQIENARNMKKLQSEEEHLSRQLRDVIGNIDKAYQNFNRKMFSNYWVLSGTDQLMSNFDKKFTAYNESVAMRRAQENLRRQAEEQLQTRLPDGVPEPIHIQKMIEIEHCLVCDRPAKEGTKEYEAISSLLPKHKPQEETVKSWQYQMLNDLYHNNMAVRDGVSNAQDEIREEIKEITLNQARMQQLKDELDAKELEIREQLRLGGSSNPTGIIDSWRITTADIVKYNADIVRDEAIREGKVKQLKSVQSELGQLSKGEIPESYTIKRDIFNDLHALTIRVKDTKYKELILILESKANEHFQKINCETGAFYGKIRFIEISEGGYRPIIIDPGKNDSDITGSLNTSTVSAMKLSIIMAIVSANANRSYTQFYPLIADAPVSDFDPVKTKAFLLESAETFSQSIIIMKEGLVRDEHRQQRYRPEMDKLNELNNELNAKNVPLKVFQIDMPDGISNENRSEITIDIKKILN